MRRPHLPARSPRAGLAAALAVAIGLAIVRTTAAAAGPAAVPLTLETAMATARAHAHEAAAANARASAAAARWREARGHRLPTVALEETYLRTDSPAEAFALALNQERFDFGAFAAADPNRPDPATTAITRLALTMPLYTGGELTARIEQSRLAMAAAASDAARAADRAALAAGEAFVGLAEAREQAALLERARETAQAHAALARAYVAQGMLVRSELLRAEVEEARVADLLAAAQGMARVAAAELAFRLGAGGELGGRGDSARRDVAPLAPAGDPGPLARWQEHAAARGDLEAARLLLAAGELEVTARRAARRPRIGLLARRDWVDDHPFGDHGDATTIAAVASIELFAGGRRRAAVAAAAAELAAAAQDVEGFARGVALEVESAWEQARSAAERQATAERALAAAREGARITGERFRAGVAKTLDWIDAATAEREAEARELAARAAAQRARLRLAVAAGRPPEAALATTTSAGDPP